MIISTWIDEAGEGETEDLADLWTRILAEIQLADRLVLYAEPDDFPLKGAYVEIGAALALEKPVFTVTPDLVLQKPSYRPLGSWCQHPLVVMTTLDVALGGRRGDAAWPYRLEDQDG